MNRTNNLKSQNLNDNLKSLKLEKEIKGFLFDEITTNKSWLLEKVSELYQGVKKVER